MPLNVSRRGRPKGSGIDDQKYLREIAELIAQKPELKPTTAIKALGITDPSAIRRLRDKFHEFSGELSASPGGMAPGRGDPISSPPSAPHSRAMPAKIANAGVSRSESAVSSRAGLRLVAGQSEALEQPPEPRAAMPSAVDFFALWCGIGISAITAALATQAAVTSSWARLPHIDMAFRQQLVLNELAVALVPARPADRAATLH